MATAATTTAVACFDNVIPHIDKVSQGNELMIAIPRAALGLAGKPGVINFKWADNIAQTGEASDFTLNGDAAPNDRFNYRAVIR